MSFYKIIFKNGKKDVEVLNDVETPLSAKLKTSINAIPSLEATFAKGSLGFESAEEMRTRWEVWEDDLKIGEGRILKAYPSMDDDGMIKKQVICEGFGGYLHDSIQPYVASQQWKPSANASCVEVFIRHLLKNHNEQVEDEKKIYCGIVDVESPFKSGEITRSLNYQTTFQCLKSKLVDKLGGEMMIREVEGKHYLDYLKNPEKQKDQAIEVGKNIENMSRERDLSSIVTRLIPLGAKIGETEERITLPELYVEDRELVKKYGILYGTAEFGAITKEESLRERGKEALKLEKVLENNKISVVDLSRIDDEYEEFELGASYPIKNTLIGVETRARVISKTLDLLNPCETEIELGTETKSLSDIASRVDNKFDEIEETIEHDRTLRDEKMSELVQKIASKNGLYQTVEKADDGSEIFYLHSQKDLKKSKIIWKMTREAMAVSTDGGEHYNAGLTADGDAILNILSANGVDAGWIRTGKLEVSDPKTKAPLFTADFSTGEVHIKSVDEVSKKVDEAKKGAEDYTDDKLENYLTTADFTVKAGEIKSTVTRERDDKLESYPDKGKVKSMIEQSAKEIKLGADQISLEGAVTANGNFKIDELGNMEARNGTFSGNVNGEGLKFKNYSGEMTYESKGLCFYCRGKTEPFFVVGKDGIMADGRFVDNPYLSADRALAISIKELCNAGLVGDFISMKEGEDYYSFIPTAQESKIYSLGITGGVMEDTFLVSDSFFGKTKFKAWTSDARRKKLITTSKINATEQIKAIPHRAFNWADYRNNSERVKCGYVAQEMEKINPQFVIAPTDEREFYQIDTTGVLPVATMCLQELVGRVEKLENEIADLKKGREAND